MVMSMTQTLTVQARMLQALFALLSLALFTLASAQEAQLYSLKLLLNGQPLSWDVGEGVERNGEFFVVQPDTLPAGEPLVVYFEGGQLELELADFGTFAHPHVTGVRFSREADPSTFSMGATVRHHDRGWDDYADTVVFEGAQNGRLTLQHPHDDEQPFTRSKNNVRAEGEVRVHALDNVRSGPGSAVVIDVSRPPFAGLERGNLRYELVRQPAN
jgi:hypothetical protein